MVKESTNILRGPEQNPMAFWREERETWNTPPDLLGGEMLWGVVKRRKV